MASSHPNADVRMRGFSERATLQQALAWLDGQLDQNLHPIKLATRTESVALGSAVGRVLATEIISQRAVPAFARAMMDGYAVRAADTEGASAYNRLPLRVLGECLPGSRYTGEVAPGCAVRIMTGAPLPDGADAVLPAELAEAVDATTSEQVSAAESAMFALGEVSPQKHVGEIGEDVAVGASVLPAGRVLRPQDIGVLSSIGMGTLPVLKKPRVRLIITGDELLPAGSQPVDCRIADANGPMLAALVSRDGGLPISPGLIPDQREAILAALNEEAEIVLVSGGSSVGQEEHVPTLLAEFGELAIHGIAMRPSSPTGMGKMSKRLVFLLPGNPVSCLCAYDFFASRAIRALSGLDRAVRPAAEPSFAYPVKQAKLKRKLVSQVGRVDYARVKFVGGEVEPLAISGAAILSSTTRADGFVILPADSEGQPAGAKVNVYLYDV